MPTPRAWASSGGEGIPLETENPRLERQLKSVQGSRGGWASCIGQRESGKDCMGFVPANGEPGQIHTIPEGGLAPQARPGAGPLMHPPSRELTEKSLDKGRHMEQDSSGGVVESPFQDLKEMMIYIKDIHWLAEKNMLITEKNMLILDDLNQNYARDDLRQKLVLQAKDSALPPLNAEEVANSLREHMGRIIREIVTEAMRPMEAKGGFPQPVLPDQSKMETSKMLMTEMVDREFKEKSMSSQRALQDSIRDQSAGINAQMDTMMRVLEQKFESVGQKMDHLERLAHVGAGNVIGVRPSIIDHRDEQGAAVRESTEDVSGTGDDEDAEEASKEIEPNEEKPKKKTEKEKSVSDSMHITTETVEEKEADVKMDMAHLFDVDGDPADNYSFGEKIVHSKYFEMVFAFLIVLNTLSMCIESEFVGYGIGYRLGLKEMTSPPSPEVDDWFVKIELGFGAIFTVEVVSKILALKWKFHKSAWNVFDFGIIAIAWIDTLLNVDLFLNPMLLRLVRLVRLLRLLRGLSAFEIFDNLHLMVRGIKAALPVLIWVVVLVFPALACCGLGINYLLVDFIQDPSNPLEDRVECFTYFGTFTKSILSMFEVTFGNWVIICRFLYSRVDVKFAFFFMAYQLVMGIAVIRIIYGVFLHVTFACATSDDDTLIAKKNRENKKFAEKMHALFQKFDASGDGSLTREEFHEIASNPLVKTWLSTMDLELTDTDLVFDLADGGDGQMNANEMVYGFSRLKGTARSIDIWALISLVRKAVHEIEKIQKNSEAREFRELKKIENLIAHRDEHTSHIAQKTSLQVPALAMPVKKDQ